MSKIEWTEVTWNPVRGCTRVSPGCKFCYAERLAAIRLSGPGQAYEGVAKMTPSGPRWTNEIKLIEEKLEEPLRWRKPRMIFVNSMSDLFLLQTDQASGAMSVHNETKLPPLPSEIKPILPLILQAGDNLARLQHQELDKAEAAKYEIDLVQLSWHW